MIKWIQIPDETKRNAYEQIAEKKGISAFVVEKDWWVCRAIDIIFKMDIAGHLVFKGGTSLSKAWHLINRFSEDIDLAIDREFFLQPKNNWSRGEITKLRKDAGAYSTGKFFDDLKEGFLKKGFKGLTFKAIAVENSDQDPRIIDIYYPNLISVSSGYLSPRVRIEVGCRSLREPFSVKKFGAFVDEVYADRDFVEPMFEVPSVNPERTFLEKLFLLHEEFHRPAEKMRVERLSRHLYDVFQLTKSGIAEKAFQGKELYETIVAHRHKFARVGGVDYNSFDPKLLNPVPIPDVMDVWKEDYKKMKEDMIYEDPKPDFEMLLDNLKELRNKLKGANWDYSLKFPKPDK